MSFKTLISLVSFLAILANSTAHAGKRPFEVSNDPSNLNDSISPKKPKVNPYEEPKPNIYNVGIKYENLDSKIQKTNTYNTYSIGLGPRMYVQSWRIEL